MNAGTCSVLAMAALLGALLAPPALAAGSEPVTAALSPPTRALLIREMQALAAAMARIHTAIVTGAHAAVVAEGGAIHDGFVLAQELEDEQRREIEDRLPGRFRAADAAFHELAGALVQAGEAGEPRLERLWFDEMTRACLSCHEEFAAARFPGLEAAEEPASEEPAHTH
jgi:hypothetical protein